MFRIIHLTALALGMVTFWANTIFGFYIMFLKLTAQQFLPLLISLALLIVWLGISFFTYFLVGIAAFSQSEDILAMLTPSFIIMVYVGLGLLLFWGFKMIAFRS